MFFLDPTYLCFMAPGFLLVMFASWYVKSAYNKWGRVGVRSGLTGAQAAQRLIYQRQPGRRPNSNHRREPDR